MTFGLRKKGRVTRNLVLTLFVVEVFFGGSLSLGEGFLGHRHAGHSSIKRSVAHYTIPGVTLVDQGNREIQFDRALANSGPVLVEFFFTTCTTFCDLRAARLASVQRELAQTNIEISFFSITVDPEFDTPDRLLRYSTRVRPIPDNWSLLTGPIADIHRVEAAFDAKNPSADKMLHQPLTFIQAQPGEEWVRLEGMMASADLAEQVRIIMAKSKGHAPHHH